MKKIFIILFIFTSFLIYSDEDTTGKFPFVATDTVGALLFAENCLGCHKISSFTTVNPDMEYVEKLAEEIDFKIYAPSSAMGQLSFLKNSDLEKIARFMIYGRHIKGWVLEEYHGEVVEEQDSDSCMKCHDNDKIKKVEIPSCNECH